MFSPKSQVMNTFEVPSLELFRLKRLGTENYKLGGKQIIDSISEQVQNISNKE